jgi:hypothetical protein
MSCGLGKIARAIHDRFVKLGWLNRSYTVSDLCREIFGTGKPSQAQRDTHCGPLMPQVLGAHCE